jgi:MoxR-like ATPase
MKPELGTGTPVDMEDWEKLEVAILAESYFIDDMLAYFKHTIVGQQSLLNCLLIGLLGNGHILLEGLPGLAKTLAVKMLAQTLKAQFSRIQFTPDILPADILGTTIYNMHTNLFSVKKGPVFSNFVLADEINRAPGKVQSALLEVMQEHQVTLGDVTYPLELPFMVLATQNPIDQSGTYELPEAQMDRFMLKVLIDYPTFEEERIIIRRNSAEPVATPSTFSIEHILSIQALVKKIFIDTKIEDYILKLVFCTRYPEKYGLAHLKPYIKFGSSPRGSINLTMAARAQAFIQKRAFVVPEDIRAVVYDVLRHRIGLTYNAVAENITTDDIIQQILQTIPQP